MHDGSEYVGGDIVDKVMVKNGFVYADGLKIGRLVPGGIEFISPRSGNRRRRTDRRRVVVSIDALTKLRERKNR